MRTLFGLVSLVRRFLGANPLRRPSPSASTRRGQKADRGAPFGLVSVGHCELGGGWIYPLGVYGEEQCVLWCTCCGIASTGAVSQHLDLVGDLDSLAPNGLRVPTQSEVEAVLRSPGAERCVAPDGIDRSFDRILHKFR